MKTLTSEPADESIPPGFTRPRGKLIFSRQCRYEAYATWNHPPDIQQNQADTLHSNVMQKRAELVREAVLRYAGEEAWQEVGWKLQPVRFEGDDAELTWWFWGEEPVAVTTRPRSRIGYSSEHPERKLYYLGFHFINPRNKEEN